MLALSPTWATKIPSSDKALGIELRKSPPEYKASTNGT